MCNLVDERLRSNPNITYEIRYNADASTFEIIFKDKDGMMSQNFLQYATIENEMYLWNYFTGDYTKLCEGNLGMVIELFFN